MLLYLPSNLVFMHELCIPVKLTNLIKNKALLQYLHLILSLSTDHYVLSLQSTRVLRDFGPFPLTDAFPHGGL